MVMKQHKLLPRCFGEKEVLSFLKFLAIDWVVVVGVLLGGRLLLSPTACHRSY